MGVSLDAGNSKIVWGDPAHGMGKKIPIAIGDIRHIGRLTQENFGEVCRVINKVTLTPWYPLGLSRANHDGTHSARQARMLQVVLKTFEKEPDHSCVTSLSQEERILLQLAAYLLRSGRVDESSHIDFNPDDYNARSALIFEEYAKQLDASQDTCRWVKNLVFYSCKPLPDKSIEQSPKQTLCWRSLSIVHELDLIRCFEKKDIEGRVKSLVKHNLSSYVSSSNSVVEKLFAFSKDLCAATGCYRVYDSHSGNRDLFAQCSSNGDFCWAKVSAMYSKELER